MRHILLLVSLTAFATVLHAQNIAINSTGAAPAASAMLDITSTTGGLLIPRMTEAQRLAIASPATGLLVYQTNASTPIPAGHFWYYDGTTWRALFTERVGWGLWGNAGTNANNNFLGTTDNVALRIRTDNTQRFEFTTGGELRSFSTGTAGAPTYSWTSNAITGIFQPAANNLGFSTNGVERMRITQPGHVGIGGTPANGAILDVQSTNRGVLIPRVALAALNNASPVGAGNVVDGLLVYNTANAGSGQWAVTPGFYRWDASLSRWRRLTDMVTEVWYVNPMNINANTRYTITTNIPGVTWTSGVTVNLAGDWAVAPDVTIHYVEARTGQVRFILTNNTGGILGGGTNYVGMDFIVTVHR